MDAIKKIIMYFTLQQREKRAYIRYEKSRQSLEALSKRQLHEKYIKLKSTYEFKKGFFTFFIVTLFLSILTGIWKTFYGFFQKTLKLFFNQENSVEVTRVILVISIFILIVLVIVLFICVVIYLKNLYRIYEQLLLIEDIRNENGQDDSGE